MFALLGMGLSVPIGMLVSPLSDEEKFTFSNIGKAMLTFASGYLLSKLDGTIADAFAPGSFAFRRGWLSRSCIPDLLRGGGTYYVYGSSPVGGPPCPQLKAPMPCCMRAPVFRSFPGAPDVRRLSPSR